MPSIRYIATSPETVVPFVKTGKFPEVIPTYLKPKSGSSHDTQYFSAHDCALSLNKPPDQIFVVEISLPDNNVTQLINPGWIQKIYVYSQKGMNILNKLFGGNCPKYAMIHIDIYRHTISPNLLVSVSSKSVQTHQNTSQTLPTVTVHQRKRKHAETSASTPLIFSNPWSLDSGQNNLPVLDRIDTLEKHIALLKHAFQTARRTLLITTYGINQETFLKAELDKLIPSATKRGLRIYIYNNDEKDFNTNSEILNFLARHGVIYSEAFTHSKILAIDHSLIVVGSFNWLSAIDRYGPNENASLLYRGDKSSQLIEDIWSYIKYYRNIQFENINRLEMFEYNPFNRVQKTYSIKDHSKLVYLATLEQHRRFICESFATAKQRIIVYSPFISEESTIDFTPEILLKTVKRGVNIYFGCLPTQIKETEFDIFLSEIGSPMIHLIPLDNIHLKTLIVDDHTIAEGSFNWLSASRDKDSSFHNHEATFVTQGSLAKQFIQHFECSELGKSLLPENQEQIKKKMNIKIGR